MGAHAGGRRGEEVARRSVGDKAVDALKRVQLSFVSVFSSQAKGTPERSG